ncbi:ABC transporter ATP-binding protein [Bosea sp. NBC_00550]|uniref:ABC transporter ATP-binding protein n=1 Tax=Bosea sp. NBC_00550 TaxID=2969621 RepID=UPI002231257D|nr:ABC transporter ATP-binding protein [Bosea sp. NBC_00550]UZF91297.1 ABC transporter ATP-binding protein [Bosea sp. NBC_00550]
MSSDASIKVDGVAKAYRVYAKPTDRLKQAIMPRLSWLVSPIFRLLGRSAVASRYFTEHWALRELSFEVARGETIGVIGRNGSGKSTLLQLICGTLTPSQGDIVVKGRVAALLELGSGFNPEYTGRENIMLNASILGLSREQTLERMAAILDFADIGEAVDQPVKAYSSGMAMRLAFAVIAHVDADVLIIDEALSVGDSYFQQKCLRWLRGFQANGTVLFCSHDTNSVLNFCDRAIWLDYGELRMAGASKDVCEGYIAFINSIMQGLPPVSVKPSRPSEQAGGADDAGKILQAKPLIRVLPPPPAPTGRVVFDWLKESAGFGSGDVDILSVELTDPFGVTPTWITGGEDLQLTARVRIVRDIASPIFGFQTKDRLGQPILGENTISYRTDLPELLRGGETVLARFTFPLPLLASGRYSVTFAVASGTLDSHSQHQWVHDALFFDVHSPHRSGALVGVELKAVSVTVEPPEAAGG